MKTILSVLFAIFCFMLCQAQYTIPYYSQQNCQSPKDHSSVKCDNWKNSNGSFRFTQETIYHSGNKYIVHDVQILGSDMKFVAISSHSNKEFRFLVDVKEHILTVVLPHYENSEKTNYITYYKFKPEEVIYE